MSSPVKELHQHIASLVALDPTDKAVVAHLASVANTIGNLEKIATEKAVEEPSKAASLDMAKTADAIGRLYHAAGTTRQNYDRVMGILEGLHAAVKVAAKPQNVAVRPRVAALVEKTAGVFALCDTVQDLDRPLAEIEKAVHSLYGDQSKNSTYYFDRRGKGHHDESK